MDKQMRLSYLSDELAQVRTKKKEFLARSEQIILWGEGGNHNSAVLLQRRARQQDLRIGFYATSAHTAESL